MIVKDCVKIIGTPHHYISRDGKVYTYRYEKMRQLKTEKNTNGREYIDIWTSTTHRLRTTVDRLVATAFIPNPHFYTYIRHVDGDLSNNHVDNLEWVSTRQGKRIKAYNLSSGETLFFNSQREAAEKLNVTASAISQIINKNSRLRTAAGYTFEYIKEEK